MITLEYQTYSRIHAAFVGEGRNNTTPRLNFAPLTLSTTQRALFPSTLENAKSIISSTRDVACNTNDFGSITQMDANRKHTQKCSRCPAVFEYDERAGWPAVSRLVNEHWAVCPYRLNLYGSDPPRPSFEPYSIGSVPSSRQGSTGSLGADGGKQDDQTIVGYGKQRKTEAERKQELENDEYAYNVQPTSVSCHGCEKEISLDKRSRYYPGLWTKHRRKCPGIQKKEVSMCLLRRNNY